VQNAEKQGQFQAFKTAIGQTISDPALMSTFLAEQLPQIIPAALTGGGSNFFWFFKHQVGRLLSGITSF